MPGFGDVQKLGETAIVLGDQTFDRITEAARYVEQIRKSSGNDEHRSPPATGSPCWVIVTSGELASARGPYYKGNFVYLDMESTDPETKWTTLDDEEIYIEEFHDRDLLEDELYFGAVAGADLDGVTVVVVNLLVAAGKGIKISCLLECDPGTGNMAHSNDCLIVNPANGNLVIRKMSDGSIVSGCECDPP